MKITEKRRNDETILMKKKIEHAALHLFLQEGVDKTTMRKIASKIKYSPATIYNYYKNKNEVFVALRQNAFILFQSYQEKSRTQSSARKRLLEHGKAYLEFALDNPELYELMFIIKAPMGDLNHDNKKKSNRSFDYLKEDIDLCMKKGLIKKTNIDVVALAFWSIGHGLASLLIRNRLTMYADKDQKQLVENSGNYLYSCLINSTNSKINKTKIK